jgi:hypothetical protein
MACRSPSTLFIKDQATIAKLLIAGGERSGSQLDYQIRCYIKPPVRN